MNNQKKWDGKFNFVMQFGKWQNTAWQCEYSFSFFGSYAELREEFTQLNELIRLDSRIAVECYGNSHYSLQKRMLEELWDNEREELGITRYALPIGRRFDKLTYRYVGKPLNNPVWGLL